MIHRPLLLALALVAGCGSVDVVAPAEPTQPPVVRRADLCMDKERVDRCAEDSSSNVALCYADDPGPAPLPGIDADWPAPGSGCAAPDEMGNVFESSPDGPRWLWWCCAPVE